MNTVPDDARITAEGAFEDIYYVHCSYFTEESLANLYCGRVHRDGDREGDRRPSPPSPPSGSAPRSTPRRHQSPQGGDLPPLVGTSRRPPSRPERDRPRPVIVMNPAYLEEVGTEPARRNLAPENLPVTAFR